MDYVNVYLDFCILRGLGTMHAYKKTYMLLNLRYPDMLVSPGPWIDTTVCQLCTIKG